MALSSQDLPGCQPQHILPIGSALEPTYSPGCQSLSNVAVGSGYLLGCQALPNALGQDLGRSVHCQALPKGSAGPIAQAQKKEQV